MSIQERMNEIRIRLHMSGLAHNIHQMNRFLKKAEKNFSKVSRHGQNEADEARVQNAYLDLRSTQQMKLQLSRSFRASHLINMMTKGYKYHEIEESCRIPAEKIILCYGPQLSPRELSVVQRWLRDETVRPEWEQRVDERAEKKADSKAEKLRAAEEHAARMKDIAEQSKDLDRETRIRFVAEMKTAS